MKLQARIAVIAGVLALAVPAMALAAPPAEPGSKGKGKGPHYSPETPQSPGPKAPLPEQAKAYGHYCQGESKKHVRGEKGTAFSRCVTAMAKAAQNERMSAKRACKGLSRKHVKGEKGTAFSRCVKAAAKLRRQQAKAAPSS